MRRAQLAHLGLERNTASGYFLYFLDLISPTILRLQTAVKLIIMSTELANGLGSAGALGMSSFAVCHDMTQR